MTKRRMILVLAAATALTALAHDSRPRARRAEGRDRLHRQCAVFGDLRLRPRSPSEFRRDHRGNAGHEHDQLGARLSRRSRAQGRHREPARPWPQSRGLSRRTRLLSRSRRRRRRSRAASHREAAGGAAARHCGPVGRRATEPAACRCARSRLRRARRAALQAHSRHRRGEGRPYRRRTLCRRRRRRHAAARLLRDEVRDLGVDGDPGPSGQTEARSARAGRSVAQSI